jgi:gluconolactonase
VTPSALLSTSRLAPRYVTSLCFGGDDLRDLYVVTGSRGGPSENCGSVFRTRVDVAGLPLHPARIAV